ncbi:MAG: phosphatase PAP2 family protein [Pseudomonadota bacterium]
MSNPPKVATNTPKLRLARGFSIAGHPMIMLPASALIYSLAAGSLTRILTVLGIAIVVSAGLGAWAQKKVGTGQWSHVDAIDPRERREWNIAVLGCFLVIAALCALYDPEFAVGVLALAFIMLSAMLLAPWLKVSQHTAFAVLSTWVVATINPAAGMAFAALSLAVAWSRLALKRHTSKEVVVGFALGALTGAGLTLLARVVGG